MRRTPSVRRKGDVRRTAQRSGKWRWVKNEVDRRCDGACEARTPLCTGHHEQTHHVLRRSQGGDDHPDNALAVCAACHLVGIHNHVDWAVRHGMLQRQGVVRRELTTGCPFSCAVDHISSRNP
jgi:hypothetical protein